MKVLDGKNKLAYSQIVSFVKGLEDDYILITYQKDGEEFEQVELKENLLNVVFDRNSLKDISNETVVSLFNGSIMLETTKKDLHFWGTAARLERLKTLFGIKKEEAVNTLNDVSDTTTETITNKVEPVKVEIKEKTIAIGLFTGYEIIEIEALTVNQKESKKAVEFLNDKISDYYVNDMQDEIRININYDKDSELNLNEWLTLKELFERGIAK